MVAERAVALGIRPAGVLRALDVVLALALGADDESDLVRASDMPRAT